MSRWITQLINLFVIIESFNMQNKQCIKNAQVINQSMSSLNEEESFSSLWEEGSFGMHRWVVFPSHIGETGN